MIRDKARLKFNMIAKSKEVMAEQTKQRGYSMVEDKVLLETPVKVEFNIDRTITEFNVREQTLILLQKMKEIDKSIKIKSVNQNNAEWDEIHDIPEDEEFNDSFQTKDFLFRKFRKVVVHMKLVSSRYINQIKYSEQVKDFLFKNNVWLKTDRFDSKIESSPGLITMVHPKLINRDEYTQEVVDALAEAYSNMTEKEQENMVESLGCKPKTVQTVPTFYLEHSIKKWRDLKAEVLRINCAKEDSEFLKQLFSYASEQNLLPRGEFLPEGLQLIENSQLVYDILNEHIEYLGLVTSIPLNGLTSEDFSTVAPEKNKTIRDILLGIEGVQSIEKARSRYFSDKWVMIIFKDKQTEILRQFEDQITVYYKNKKGQSKLILAGPKKFNTPTLTSNRVHTYADLLKQKYSTLNTRKKQANSQILKDTEDRNARDDLSSDTLENAETITPAEINNELAETEKRTELENTLLQRITDIENKQTQIEQEQEQLKLKQADKNRTASEVDKQAENKKTEDLINRAIETKIEGLKQDYTTQIARTEQSLQSKIDNTLNDKVNTISAQVGNQIAVQLMEMFKGYISPGQSIGGQKNLGTSGVPFITQDSPTVSTPQKQISALPWTTNNSDTTDNLQKIPDTDTQNTDIEMSANCSPHDTFLEQEKSSNT